jgi:hypothetical protein
MWTRLNTAYFWSFKFFRMLWILRYGRYNVSRFPPAHCHRQCRPIPHARLAHVHATCGTWWAAPLRRPLQSSSPLVVYGLRLHRSSGRAGHPLMWSSSVGTSHYVVSRPRTPSSARTSCVSTIMAAPFVLPRGRRCTTWSPGSPLPRDSGPRSGPLRR